MTNATEVLVRLGRFMITNAPQLADDTTCNNWARVGQLLTGLGMPFAPKLREFDAEDQRVLRSAAAVMSGRDQMPPKLVFHEPQADRRPRKARMTKVMTKPARKMTVVVKATKSTKVTQAGEPVRRGRPPGSKNKPKVVATTNKK